MEVKRMRWEQKLEVGDDLPKTEAIMWAENISFSHLRTFHAVKWLQNERGWLAQQVVTVGVITRAGTLRQVKSRCTKILHQVASSERRQMNANLK